MDDFVHQVDVRQDEEPIRPEMEEGEQLVQMDTANEVPEDQPEETRLELPLGATSMEASSFEVTPAGSPLGAEDVSRAGRKRKINTKYMEEPSPVHKPVVRKSLPKKAAAPAPPSPKNAAKKGSLAKDESIKSEEPLVTGPPTFGSILFGRSRKLSDSLSDADFLDDEEEIPDILSDDEDDVSVPVVAVFKEAVAPAVAAPVPIAGQRMAGVYVASGAVGPVSDVLAKLILTAPSGESSIKFPDLTTEEYLASVPERLPILAELGGGGVWSLLPSKPVHWFRDEVPKLSAYFRKKMDAAGGIVKPVPVEAEKRPTGLTQAQREERRRQKEAERKRLIDERNRRRERERLKQLYRQHWLALTKFPIEDDLLHSHKGIRRLGHPLVQCRTVAEPLVFWDCRLGPPGTLAVSPEIAQHTTELLDEIFVVWNFFSHFKPLLGGPDFSLPQLVEGVLSKQMTPLIQDVYVSLLTVLRPWIEHQVTTLLQAEQGLESQLTKNRGRAKLHWSSLCQFRDFLFLGYSVLVGNVAGSDTTSNWPWTALYCAKAMILFEAIEPRTKEFLSTISTAFEEIDFEHKWIFDWELDCNWTFDAMPFAVRVKLLKLLVDKIVALPVVKKLVDVSCEGRAHVIAEIAAIEKEERKLTQRITLCQKLQAIIAQAPAEAASIQLPMTEAELSNDIRVRDALAKHKRLAQTFNDTELAVRLESIGRDRHMNEYFQVSCLRHLVFVRQHSVSHPNVVRYGIYDSLANIEALIQSLDDRGVRELSLKLELQKIKAVIFSDLVARGDGRFDAPSCDWLGHGVVGQGAAGVADSVTEVEQVKFLNECVELTKNGLDRIKSAWTGEGVDADDDDVTVDENASLASDEDMDQGDEELAGVSSAGNSAPFTSERESFYESVMALADVLTESMRSSLLAFPKAGETPATTSSVLVQFHIKTGADLLRHVSIPSDQAEFFRLLDSVDVKSQKSMSQTSAVFLEGLHALDEIVHEEIARHDASAGSIEIWPATGGEKHAWKKFSSNAADQQQPASPSGEEDDQQPSPEDEEAPSVSTNTAGFGCDGCGKKFQFHILLGVHKLHPCKTRGRKPLPVDPVMEVLPVPANNGVVAIDKIVSPEYPALPSSRQEAVERAEKAAAAAAAGDVVPVAQSEFICDICGKVFPHNQGLAVHQTRWCIPEQQAQLLISAQQAVGTLPAPTVSAPETGPVNCETCGKPFPTAQGLAIHQTRWCRGPDHPDAGKNEDDARKAEPVLKTLHVEPVFRAHPVSASELVSIVDEAGKDAMMEEEQRREPGFTPACYSLAGVSVAILWFKTRLETALGKFNSEKVHRSGTGKARPRK